MENDPTFFSVLISWFPMLLLIVVWVWYMLRMKGVCKSNDGRSSIDLLVEQVDEQRKTNKVLERLASDYEERLKRLEQQQ